MPDPSTPEDRAAWRRSLRETPLPVPHVDFDTPTGNPQVIARIGYGLTPPPGIFRVGPPRVKIGTEDEDSAGRDDTRNTRDNPREAGAAADRGAPPPGQRYSFTRDELIEAWTVSAPKADREAGRLAGEARQQEEGG